MTAPRTAKRPGSSQIEIKARIWRALDRDAIGDRGNPLKQEALRDALRELRKAIDDSKAQS